MPAAVIVEKTTSAPYELDISFTSLLVALTSPTDEAWTQTLVLEAVLLGGKAGTYPILFLHRSGLTSSPAIQIGEPIKKRRLVTNP